MKFVIHRAKEIDLLEGCRKRDPAAQKRLYETHAARMFAVCTRYLKDTMLAEDALIASFTKVFEKIDQFKGEGSFEGWIRRIVINEALCLLRKNRTMYLETDLDHHAHVASYEQLEAQLDAEDLMNMIHELPAGYKIVFNMYALDGYTHKEIASHLGISENTSKSQLNRARKFLQNMLAEREAQLSKKINL